ncbi:MAG: NYN domain-containing protein [Pseudorhodobacter sp.]|nr:NYN domain-containing protein [Rhizobacter sp.]
MDNNANHNVNHNRRLNRDQNRVMLLIDADNVSSDVIVQAFERVMAEQRAIHVRRAYCTAELAAKHLKLFKALSIRPIVNVSTGKNSTDIALAVDAIDLVISERPDLVVLVSSDSDFAPLVIRLREKGCRVEGIGQEGKTADDSKLVYDRFVDIEHRKASTTNRRTASVDAPVRKAVPRGRSRAMERETEREEGATEGAMNAEPLAPAASPAPERQARQPRAPREAARENTRSRTTPAARVAAAVPPRVAASAPAPVAAAVPALAQRLAALPDDLTRIMNALPELRSGTPLQLGVAAERLRAEGLLAKSAPSTKLFKKYPDLFVLTPARAPNKVQFRGTDNS